MRPDQFDRLDAVAARGKHLDIARALQQVLELLPGQRLIIDNHNTQRHRSQVNHESLCDVFQLRIAGDSIWRMPSSGTIALRSIATALMAACLCVTAAYSQSSLISVPGTGPIPSEHFKSWSLFLLCDSKWVQNNQADPNTGLPGYGTYVLFKNFQSFGNAIGDDNLAVWFWRSNSPVNSLLASNVDVTRAQHFCTAYKLKPNKGPYLVVTSSYPDEANLGKGLPPDSAVFALGNMKLNQITALLDQVSQRLNPTPASAPSPPPGATPATPTPTKSVDPWQVRLLVSVQQVLDSFGCAWTFKIDAGAAQADLHACGKA